MGRAEDTIHGMETQLPDHKDMMCAIMHVHTCS
jgi:hypothetical protein